MICGYKHYVEKHHPDEIKIGLIEYKKREDFLKTFIGKECQICKKKHYKSSTVLSCLTIDESEKLFIEYMKKKIKEFDMEMKGSGNQDNQGETAS